MLSGSPKEKGDLRRLFQFARRGSAGETAETPSYFFASAFGASAFFASAFGASDFLASPLDFLALALPSVFLPSPLVFLALAFFSA